MKNKNKKSPIYIKILIITNILSIISLLFSYLSIYINPATTTFFAFFGLGLLFILLFNTIFALIWSFIRIKYTFINLIIILLGWNLIWNHIHIQVNSYNKKDKAIKILSYNTHNFAGQHYDYLKCKDMSNEIKSYLIQNDFDIACFQEFFSSANDNTFNDSLIKALNFPYYYFATYGNSDDKIKRDATAIFSKFPIIKKAKINNAQNEIFAIYTDLIINGDTNRVFNIQLKSFKVGTSKDSIRLSAFKKLDIAFKLRTNEVEYLLNEIENSPFPVIICGDFNDTPASYTYKKISNGLTDTYTASSFNIGNTYFWNLPPIRIDNIIINKNYKPIFYKVDKVPYSDHYPIVAKFILKNEK